MTTDDGYPGIGEGHRVSDRPADQAAQKGRPTDAGVDTLRVTRSRALPDVIAVRLAGEVDLANATRLRAAIIDAIKEHPGSVSVDLSGLTHCGSAGLAALVDARRAAAAAGVGFTVVNPHPHARRVIETTGLREFLAVHETTDEAP